MSLEILKKELSSNTIRQLYLFYGIEKYLTEHYTKELEKMLIAPSHRNFNYIFFENKLDESDLTSAIETMPFMSKNKLVVLKNISQELRFMDKIKEIPEGVFILFIEDDIDKRTKKYKEIKKYGLCVEFEIQSQGQLEKWVMARFGKNNITVKKEQAIAIIHSCDFLMTDIITEVEKLVSFTGDDGALTDEAIQQLCTKRPNNKIFEMIEAVGQKKSQEAYNLLNDMLALKESPQKIISLFARHFKFMFYIKSMKSKKFSNEKIGEKIGLHSFIVGKYIGQCQHFSTITLKQAMTDCLNMDRMIKLGKMDSRIAVESFIFKYGG